MSNDPINSLSDSKMLELLKKINQIKAQMTQTEDEKQKGILKRELSDAQMHYNILAERKGSF